MPTPEEIRAAAIAMQGYETGTGDDLTSRASYAQLARVALAAAEAVRNRVRDKLSGHYPGEPMTSAELEDAMTASRRPSRESRIDTLFEAIKHGDEKHKDWLQQAIEDHFAGLPVKRWDSPATDTPTADRYTYGPCLRHHLGGTAFTWVCHRCAARWVDRRETDWRPYVCRLNGTPDADTTPGRPPATDGTG
jgi:rubrerythrin